VGKERVPKSSTKDTLLDETILCKTGIGLESIASRCGKKQLVHRLGKPVSQWNLLKDPLLAETMWLRVGSG
jgi:hypothetical protein